MAQLQRLTIALSQISHQQITLTPEQQHYLGRVLRLRKGDRFIALSGQGHEWLAELSEHLSEAQILKVVTTQTELSVAVTLLVALPKGNGMDEIVRQATELGVACIMPVISDRTLLNPSPQKLERWRRIAQEAAEQSERQIVPTILDSINFTASLQEQSGSRRYLCVARGSVPHLLDCLQNASSQPDSTTSIVIATGPEGGWTEAEVTEAIAAGYQPVSLGDRVLRAVTAPIAALSLISAVLESEQVKSESGNSFEL